MKLFSQNIETLRVKNRRSKAEMARQFGVTFSSYKRWEEGTEPKLEKVVEISKYYNISLDTLLTEDISTTHYQKPPVGNLEKVSELDNPYLSAAEMKQLETLQKTMETQEQVIKQMLAAIEQLKQQIEKQSKEMASLKK